MSLRVFVLGGSGTIGRATVAALVARGHRVVCLVRPRGAAGAGHAPDELRHRLPGAELRFGDPCDAASLARDGLAVPLPLADPDGNRLTLVPTGADGVTAIAIELLVRNRDAHDHFWRHVMQFEHLGPGVYGLGDSRVVITGEADVAQPVVMKGPGWRYLTVQIRDCRREHAGVLARGGTEAAAPRVLGDTVRFAMVADPDGNQIELSERASLVGGLRPD